MTDRIDPKDPRFLPITFSKGIFTARKATTRIVIHALDTLPSWRFDIREVHRWHTDPKPRGRGWKAIGYHFVIAREGIVVPGRPADVIGAHCEGWNSSSISIALAGGKDAIGMGQRAEDLYTGPQLDLLRSLVGSMLAVWPSAEVVGHRDHPKVKKLCPGFDAGEWYHGHA